MAFDPARFRVLVHTLSAERDGERGVTADDARAIIAIATLAANAGLDEDRDEAALLTSLTDELCATAQISPATLESLSPLPMDRTERVSRIREFAGRLTDARSRELAYVASYLVVIADLELAPVETAFLDELRQALGLDEARAAELAESAAQFLTPGTTS